MVQARSTRGAEQLAVEANEARVLFLEQWGEIGGAELSLLDLARAMPGRCHVLLFLGGPYAELLRANGVSTEVAAAGEGFVRVPRGAGPFRVLAGLGGLWALVRQVARRARGYDVIYANTQKALIVGGIAARLTGKPLIWHLRDLLDAKEVSGTARGIARVMANGTAAAVVANSRATEQAFLAIGGRARTAMIYNGIDPAGFGPGAGEPTPPLPPFARPGPIIGVFSRLAEWKGQHVAIEALARLREGNLILAGGPLFGTEGYEARLKRMADELGLADRVLFTGARRDIGALMRRCDIIVHTSTSAEPFGRVVIEGMLSGKAVIATNAGGVPEIIEDGVTGLLIEPGDAAALAAAVGRLLADPALRERIATAGRRHAERTFSVEAYQRGVADVIVAVRARRRLPASS